MFLTQADLSTEQRYWRIKRRLSNRAAGQGVVWGLRATYDQQTRRLTVSPGYALDCCGNDLVVPAAIETSENDILRAEGVGRTRASGPVKGDNTVGDVAHLVLQYVELAEEPRPLHKDACTPDPTCCEPSRVRETTRLLLVPPPPAAKPLPLAEFAQAMEKINVLAAGYTKIEKGQAEAVGAHTPPFSIRVRLGDETRVVTGDALEKGAPDPSRLALVVPKSQKEVTLSFDLVPARDGVFYAGRVTHSAGTMATVKAPFDLHLGWTLKVNLPGKSPKIGFKVDGLGVTQLFGRSRSLWNATINAVLDLSTDDLPGGPATRICLHDLQFNSVEGPKDDPAPATAEGSCTGTSDGSIGLSPDAGGAPGVTAPALILAALYAYLGQTLRGLDPAKPEIYDGQRLAATWIYTTAWRLFFGINPAAPESVTPGLRKELAGLLESLFSAWCDGFTYAGPRCLDEHEHHGVVLGTVTLNAGGAVRSFDAWKGRRHVLTGPLLNHWAGQVGLAPIDVTVSRLVRTICCVASDSRQFGQPTLPELPTASLATSKDNHVTTATFGMAATDLLDGCLFQIGNPQETEARLVALGFEIVRSEQVSFPRLAWILAQALAANTAGTRRLVQYRLQGGTAVPHVYVPEPPVTSSPAPTVNQARRDAFRVWLIRYLGPILVTLPPVSRKPVEDLLVELVFLAPFLAEALAPLQAEGLDTVGALLATDPESLVERLATDAHKPADVALELCKLWTEVEPKCKEGLKAIIQALLTTYARKPILRSDLGSAKVSKAIAPGVAQISDLKGTAVDGLIACAAESAMAIR
jgi:hypothetical protein